MNNAKINTMKTTKEIRQANPQGKMTKVSGTNDIVFDNGVTFTSESSREMKNLWNKLTRMGFNQHYNFSSDEMAGICEAGKIGENPFAYSIICADTKRNGIFK